MCNTCQKEMSRHVRITLLMVILGLGSLFVGYLVWYHDDLMRPFKEYRAKERAEQLDRIHPTPPPSIQPEPNGPWKGWYIIEKPDLRT